MQMKHCVHLHGHDMLTVPLTVLLHHPITSMTSDCPISAQIRLVITNQVWEYYFVIVLINNGNRTQWSSIWSVIIRVINKIRWPRSGSPICQSRLWLPALSIKGKITERWLVEREGIFFLIEGIFSNQERAWLPVNDWLIRCIATVHYLEILIFLRINFALYW